jgi:hypothetical protein
MFGIGAFNALRNGSQPNPPTTFTANNAFVSNAANDLPAAAPVTYTVAQISAHMNDIPTGTDLSARGFYFEPHVSGGWAPSKYQMDPCSVLLYGGTVGIQHGEADPRDYCRFSVLLQDENTDQILVCNMSLEEAQVAKRLYHYKSSLLAHGTYASSLDFTIMAPFNGERLGVPALDGCTLEPSQPLPVPTPVAGRPAPPASSASPTPESNDAPPTSNQSGVTAQSTEAEADVLYQQKRYSEALPLFDQGCTAGNGDACKGLGVLYANGLGVAQDFTRAAELFSKSCNEGNVRGCFNLGVSYKFGKGVKQDYPRAATLFSQSCNGGDAMGCEALGLMYELGIGLAKDASRAASLYSKACNEGNANGCNHLGKTTDDQASVTKNKLDKATRIMVAIIEQKIHPAQLDASFTSPQISFVDNVAGGNRNAAGDNRPTKGISGQVVLVCVIETDGNCQHWDVLKSVDPTEDQAVIDGLSGVHFLPATEYGHPIAYPFVEKVTLDFAK